jgi:uncharacterized protein YjbJ (UPF0337 family)
MNVQWQVSRRRRPLRFPLLRATRLNGVLETNKDRVEGAAKTVSGKLKESVGKLTGDQKTVAKGHAEQKVGKVQNAVGGLKDTIRDIQKAK